MPSVGDFSFCLSVTNSSPVKFPVENVPEDQREFFDILARTRFVAYSDAYGNMWVTDADPFTERDMSKWRVLYRNDFAETAGCFAPTTADFILLMLQSGIRIEFDSNEDGCSELYTLRKGLEILLGKE